MCPTNVHSTRHTNSRTKVKSGTGPLLAALEYRITPMSDNDFAPPKS